MRLGDLYQRLGLVSEALRQFSEATEVCQSRGLKREAFDLLKRIASLDPSNVSNRLKLADLLSRDCLDDEAREQYGLMLGSVEEPEDLLRVAEQALESYPDMGSAYAALARGRIALGQTSEAIELLERLRPLHADDIELREALISAYEASGDTSRVQSIYREIAELHKRRGEEDKARDILQRFVPVEAFGDPDTDPSLELSDEAFGTEGLDLDLDTPSVPIAPSPELTARPTTPGDDKSPETKPPDATPPSLSSEEELGDLLAEARVSLEFRDLDTAECQARRMLAAMPHSDDGREVLATALEKRGELGEALRLHRERLALASAGGDGELLSRVESDVSRLREQFEQAQNQRAPEPEPGPVLDGDSLPDIEIVLIDEEDGESAYASVDPPPELGPSDTANTLPTDPSSESLLHDAPPDLHDELPPADPASPPPPPDLHEELPPVTPAAQPADDLIEELEPDFTWSSIDDDAVPVVQAEEKSASWAESSIRVQANLSEAEAAYERGDFSDAEARFQAVLESAPNHPQALLRLGEIASHRSREAESMRATARMLREPEPVSVPAPPPAPAPVPAAVPTAEPEGLDEGDFDLAAELADELGVQTDTVIDTDPDGFESVLQSFKKGIHEQIGPDECEARYDLAIAYKEMGLVDDAIENLELAIQGGARCVEALSLLAGCKLELGRPGEAVIHLEMALRQAGEGPDTTMSLHYELGCALRAAERTREALDAFRKVAACDTDFREVQQQISELETLTG